MIRTCLIPSTGLVGVYPVDMHRNIGENIPTRMQVRISISCYHVLVSVDASGYTRTTRSGSVKTYDPIKKDSQTDRRMSGDVCCDSIACNSVPA